MEQADSLPAWQRNLIYVFALTGFSFLVVLGTSVLYYTWRRDFPNRARQVNRHGWFAFLGAIVVWGFVGCAGRLLAHAHH